MSLVWRITYWLSGIAALVIGILMLTTNFEPSHRAIWATYIWAGTMAIHIGGRTHETA